MSGMPGTSDTSQRDPVHPGGASAGPAVGLNHTVWGAVHLTLFVIVIVIAVDVAVIHAVVVHSGALEAPS